MDVEKLKSAIASRSSARQVEENQRLRAFRRLFIPAIFCLSNAEALLASMAVSMMCPNVPISVLR